MWLRTTVAVVALAAILSCGALIDGVKEFPGPWALVPVGATMLFILSAANRLADPHTGGQTARAQPAAGHGAVRVARGDGLLAVPVALAAADLLAVLHRTCRAPTSLEGAGVLLVSGVLAWLTTQVRREPAALPVRRRRTGPSVSPAAHPAAQADDRAGLGGRAARCGADRDVVHLARARHRRARERQRAVRPFVDATIPAPTHCSTRPRCRSCRCARRCSRPRRICPRPPTTAASATSTTST